MSNERKSLTDSDQAAAFLAGTDVETPAKVEETPAPAPTSDEADTVPGQETENPGGEADPLDELNGKEQEEEETQEEEEQPEPEPETEPEEVVEDKPDPIAALTKIVEQQGQQIAQVLNALMPSQQPSQSAEEEVDMMEKLGLNPEDVDVVRKAMQVLAHEEVGNARQRAHAQQQQQFKAYMDAGLVTPEGLAKMKAYAAEHPELNDHPNGFKLAFDATHPKAEAAPPPPPEAPKAPPQKPKPPTDAEKAILEAVGTDTPPVPRPEDNKGKGPITSIDEGLDFLKG